MTNYVVAYNFSDTPLQTDFAQRIKKQYPQHREGQMGKMEFLAFAARQEPGVEDNIRHQVNSARVANNDIIALYFSGKKNPDEIKRVLLLGTDEVAEGRLEGVNKTQLNNLLIDLLSIDFVKEKMAQQKS